jgi:hypothetical protein
VPATCEYVFVTVRRCSPRSAGVDGEVTAKLLVLPTHLLDGDVGADDLGLQESLERPTTPVCPGHIRQVYNSPETSRFHTLFRENFRILE